MINRNNQPMSNNSNKEQNDMINRNFDHSNKEQNGMINRNFDHSKLMNRPNDMVQDSRSFTSLAGVAIGFFSILGYFILKRW